MKKQRETDNYGERKLEGEVRNLEGINGSPVGKSLLSESND